VRNTDTDPSTAWANSTPFKWGFQSWTGFSIREFGVLDLLLTEAYNAGDVYQCHIRSFMWMIASICVSTVYDTILDATHLKLLLRKTPHFPQHRCWAVTLQHWNETTTQWTFVPGNESVDVSFPGMSVVTFVLMNCRLLQLSLYWGVGLLGTPWTIMSFLPRDAMHPRY